MNRRVTLPPPVAAIYRAVTELEALYPGRKFTPDGHDAFDADGDVQIKMTGGESVSLYATCDRLVVLRIVSPEEAEIVYDGDGKPTWDEAGPMGTNGQRRVSIKRLAAIATRRSTA